MPGSSVGIRERNAPMATDTVSVVRHRSVASPEASNTAHGPVLDAMVGNRAPFFSSIVSGPSVGRRDWNEAPMITDTFSRVEYSVGASVPPKTVQGPGSDTMAGKRPPLSPSTVSGPSAGTRGRKSATLSPRTVSATGIYSGSARIPSMRQSPDFVSGARSLAGGHEPRVLNMGASGARDGRCDERRAASRRV